MKGVVGRNSQLRSRRRWWAWTSGPCGNPYTGDLQIPPEKKKQPASANTQETKKQPQAKGQQNHKTPTTKTPHKKNQQRRSIPEPLAFLPMSE